MLTLTGVIMMRNSSYEIFPSRSLSAKVNISIIS